jgi:TetR/AcrR family transcriptional regulator
VQIKAVTGKDLSDSTFFDSTLSNIQHIILDGLKSA